jgi:hypothetical protein
MLQQQALHGAVELGADDGNDSLAACWQDPSHSPRWPSDLLETKSREAIVFEE